MKLARVMYKNKKYYTKVVNGKYYPLDNDYFNYSSISSEPLLNIDKILPPIVPSKVVAFGLNYDMHIKEFGGPIPDEPVIFLKPTTAIIGQDDYIVLPKRSSRVDYEAELAIVMSNDCKNISRHDAKDYILGYTCLNDVTARDIQKVDGQWTRAKGYDTFCPIGPCIVTDIDVSSLAIWSILNGDIKQNGNTRDMIRSVYEIVEFVSSVMTLNKGDIIATGTPSGIGPMVNGDIIEIKIEEIGTLRNRVKNEE